MRTVVSYALVMPAVGAVHLLTAAVFFTSAETEDGNGGNAAEILRRSLRTWNPHVRQSPAIRQNGFAHGHERRFRQDVQGTFRAFLSIEAIVGPSDNLRLNRWTRKRIKRSRVLVIPIASGDAAVISLPAGDLAQSAAAI